MIPKIPDRQKLLAEYKKNATRYEALMHRLQRRIVGLFEHNGVNADVKYRVKTFDSYFEKIMRLRSRHKRPKLTDLFGLRIICPFLEDLDQVERILVANFEVKEVEYKGLRHSFREFGYDSIHMLLDVPELKSAPSLSFSRNVLEVQLRTILQDAWAEVEHELIYKANFSLLNAPIKRKLASLNAILTLSDVIFQEIRDYQKEVQTYGLKLRRSMQQKLDNDADFSLIPGVEKEMLTEANFKLATPIQPKNSSEKLLFQALQMHSAGKMEKAIELYTRLLRMRINETVRSIVYNHRGMAQFVLSRYDKAQADFEKALEFNYDNFRALNNLGLTLRFKNRFDKSLHVLNRSLELNASQHEAYYMRALTHKDLGDMARALKDCDRALNLKPDFEPAMRLKQLVLAHSFGG